MKKPLVSIITPSFNQGQFIEDTIKSVLNQTYDNIEYIVIDGTSTDNTLSILEKYHSKLKFISEKDTGQSNAINKGFTMSKGEIIGWINADDVLLPDSVEMVVKEFQAKDNLSIVYGNCAYIDEFNETIRSYGRDLHRFPNINLNYLLHKKAAVSQPGSFYSTPLVKKVGYLDESLHYAMDYDLWIRLLRVGEIKFIDRVLANFRIHSTSKTVSHQKAFAPEIYRVARKYGGSLDVVPSYYLKENFYEYWSERLRPVLAKAFNGASNKKIGIYGLGSHTLGMLELYEKMYGKINFEIFYFDSDKNKWEKTFNNYKVYAPEYLDKLQLDRVIISSYTYQEEIFEQIMKYTGNKLKIIKLYQKEEDNIVFL